MIIESETGGTADDVAPNDSTDGDREGTGLGSRSKPVTRCLRSIMERAKAWRGHGVLADPTHDFKEAGVIGGAPGMLPTTGVTRGHVDGCCPANSSREVGALHFRYQWSSPQRIHSNAPLGPRGNC